MAIGVIEKGTVAAMRFEINGMVDGKPAVVVEHITRVRGDLRPELVALASSSVAFVGVALDASGLQSSDCAAATVGRQVVAWFALVPDAVADVVRHGGLDGRFPDLVVDLSACRP